MYLCGIQSDQLYTWSDENPQRAHGRLTKTPQRSSAPIAPAASGPARLPHRALQTVWQAGMQMRRRPRAWSQVLFVGKLPGLAAANGLRTAGVLCANGGVPRQLPPSPRDSGGNLRDQPRTTAPSRGPLKGRHERIPTWAHSQVKQILDLLNGLQRGDDHRPVVHVGNRHAVN